PTLWHVRSRRQLPHGTEWRATPLLPTQEIPDARPPHLPQELERSNRCREKGARQNLRRDSYDSPRVRLDLQYYTVLLREEQGPLHRNGAGREEAAPPQLCPGGPLLLGPERRVQHNRRSR